MPSSQANIAVLTLPETTRETFLFPFRAVVASKTATLYSKSEQQSPPKSAA